MSRSYRRVNLKATGTILNCAIFNLGKPHTAQSRLGGILDSGNWTAK